MKTRIQSFFIIFFTRFKSWKYKAKSILCNKSRQPDAANVFAPSGVCNVSRIMFAGPVELRRRDSNKPTTNGRLCSIIRGGPGGHVPPPPRCSPVPLLCHFLA